VVNAALEIDGFSSVQSTWNPFQPSAGSALERAHDAGWFVVVEEAMANGRLVAEDSALGRAALSIDRELIAASDVDSHRIPEVYWHTRAQLACK